MFENSVTTLRSRGEILRGILGKAAMVSTPLKVYVTCTVVLYGKFLATTLVQAIKTFDAGGRSPEDSKHVLAKGRPQHYGLDAKPADDDDRARQAKILEVRWKRIVMNDLESLPFALFVFGAGVLVEAHQRVEVAAMVAYTVARIGHTVAYAKALQPHRAYCWRIGVISTTVGGINALIAAYK